MTRTYFQLDTDAPFQFIGVDDTGPESHACCPHCGAEGRYIYRWAEYGKVRGAMAGCFAALTGKIKKNDVDSYIQRLSVKLAKNKPLNGWDRTVVRMQKYISDNLGDEGKAIWANGKIREAVADAKRYQAERFR